MRTMIHQREPVFTIGRTPFVAGAVYIRNEMRVLKQREKARKRKALAERIFERVSSLHNAVPRYLSTRRVLALARSPATASA